MDHAYGRPWIKIDETVTPILAEIVGELASAPQSRASC
jgi:kynureninase